MGIPASRGPADKAFEGGMELPILGTSEPQLGRVFEFNLSVGKPVTSGGRIPTDPLTRYAQQVPMGSPTEDKAEPGLAAPPAPPNKPPYVATAAPAPEEPEGTKISAERMAFLERVEALVAAEGRINDLESENKALISIVSRLQREVDLLKGAHKA